MSDVFMTGPKCFLAECECYEMHGKPIDKADTPPLHDGCDCFAVNAKTTKKALCVHCNYWRPQGVMDVNIPGRGNWCSNSKAAFYRRRTKKYDTCKGFARRGSAGPRILLRQMLEQILKVMAQDKDSA